MFSEVSKGDGGNSLKKKLGEGVCWVPGKATFSAKGGKRNYLFYKSKLEFLFLFGFSFLKFVYERYIK